MNSKRKGKNGELELVRLLRANGYDKARRSAQYCGNTGAAADVVGLPGLHVEVKRVEHLNVYDALAQAKRDAEAEGAGNIPVVMWRRNEHKWLAVLEVEEGFIPIYREYEAGLN